MANVCIVRHQGYIKSRMRLPFQHNFRTLNNYGNKNIDASLNYLNTNIVNNLKDGETYLTAFNRLYENGEFKGQLKVQGAEEKQTKFADEFLIYPPNEKITEMSLEKQEEFFKKELKVLQEYFPYIKILSAHIHRDEAFHPKDEEMKALFPEGKVTPHMHVIAIPIVHDKKNDCKKISITELWKGKFSYRKFQDYMYNAVGGNEYGFDRGVMHDFGEDEKYLEVEAFKLKEAEKSLNKLEAEIKLKEYSLEEWAKNLELEEHMSVFNIKNAGVQIVEHLKKENDSEYRFISLTNTANENIRKAREFNPNGEFIFERDGERITARAVTYWLIKYCRDAGITYKSPHCTRRTTASCLSTAGMSLEKIRDILGQVEERTTLGYIYNPNTIQENLDIMNKALNNSNKKNKKK